MKEIRLEIEELEERIAPTHLGSDIISGVAGPGFGGNVADAGTSGALVVASIIVPEATT